MLPNKINILMFGKIKTRSLYDRMYDISITNDKELLEKSKKDILSILNVASLDLNVPNNISNNDTSLVFSDKTHIKDQTTYQELSNSPMTDNNLDIKYNMHLSNTQFNYHCCAWRY